MYRFLAGISLVGLYYSGVQYGITGEVGYGLLALLCSGFPIKMITKGVTDA